MKKEVSCKALEIYFEWAKKKNFPPEALCAGVTYPLSLLRNRHERVEWDVYCTMTANLRSFVTEAELETLGSDAIASGSTFVGATLVGKLLFDCGDLYWWMNSGRRGPGPQLFNCIDPTTVQSGKNHLTITLQLTPDHQYCREFFLIAKGSLVAMSTILGLEPAKVEMREIEGGAIYDVFYPEGGGALSWLRKAVTWPFTARIVARELKEANEVLHERYSQLEDAQSKIQHQALQLQTAFSISEVIRRNLNLDATIEAVAQSLIDVAHFYAAEVTVGAGMEADRVNRTVARGTVQSREPALKKTLEARSQSIGNISVWLTQETDPDRAEELLDQIMPSIAMEIDDALSYTLLTEFRDRDKLRQDQFSRQQIESQEMERKRLAAELHDGLGQDLLVASNELQLFLQGNEESRENVHRAADLLYESIQTVREIASNLHPHHLDRLGFCAAIEAMVETIAHSTGLTIECSSDTVDNLFPKESEIHLYRIIQEALSNVVRHASATNVVLQVKKRMGLVEILVTDDGQGFIQQPGSPLRSSHGDEKTRQGFGLLSMNERAKIIGATLTVTSRPGKGTRVALTVPYS